MHGKMHFRRWFWPLKLDVKHSINNKNNTHRECIRTLWVKLVSKVYPWTLKAGGVGLSEWKQISNKKETGFTPLGISFWRAYFKKTITSLGAKVRYAASKSLLPVPAYITETTRGCVPLPSPCLRWPRLAESVMFPSGCLSVPSYF